MPKGQFIRIRRICSNIKTRTRRMARSWYHSLLRGATQPAHDVRTMLYGRCYNVGTLKQRHYNVVLTLCAGWVQTKQPREMLQRDRAYWPKNAVWRPNPSNQLILNRSLSVPGIHPWRIFNPYYNAIFRSYKMTSIFMIFSHPHRFSSEKDHWEHNVEEWYQDPWTEKYPNETLWC